MTENLNFRNFQKFSKLKKALNLREDMVTGQRWGPTYCCQDDLTFLVKNYEGKVGAAFLKTFVQDYENAIEQLSKEEDINDHIEISPLLHVGEDFIVKPWIILMLPVNEIKPGRDSHKAYLALIDLIKDKTKNPDLKAALLRSAKKGSTYFHNPTGKLLFADLDFE